MLPEIGATELMVIAAVALIVVGPKDLPMLMRKLGQFIARLRGMASEFRASFDDMARQSELDDLRREVEAMRSARFADIVPEASSDLGVDASEVMQEINRSLTAPDSQVQLHPAIASEPAAEHEATKP
jgi:sec-independent protein translocase protein TatB